MAALVVVAAMLGSGAGLAVLAPTPAGALGAGLDLGVGRGEPGAQVDAIGGLDGAPDAAVEVNVGGAGAIRATANVDTANATVDVSPSRVTAGVAVGVAPVPTEPVPASPVPASPLPALLGPVLPTPGVSVPPVAVPSPPSVIRPPVNVPVGPQPPVGPQLDAAPPGGLLAPDVPVLGNVVPALDGLGTSPAGTLAPSSEGAAPGDSAQPRDVPAPVEAALAATVAEALADVSAAPGLATQAFGAADGTPPPRVVTRPGAGDLGDLSLPSALVVALAAGLSTTGAAMSLRGRPIPGAGMLSVAFGAIALSSAADLLVGSPDADSWRARLELAVLAIPPWAIARQVRLLTRTPTRWLRVVDLSAAALVALVLVTGAMPTSEVATSVAPVLAWLLALVLFVVAWISVRRMLRSSRRHDPHVARVRAAVMEWVVAAFLLVYLAWITAPLDSSAFLAASIGMFVLSAALTAVAVMPRPVSAAFDRVGSGEMTRSIEMLVGTKALEPVFETVMDGFADGLGVDGLAFVQDGHVVEFGGRCAMRRDRRAAVSREVVEEAGPTTLVAWPNHLMPVLGRRCRERMRVAARLLQAAHDRDRLLAVERDAIATASQTAAALADANQTLRETTEIKGAFVSSVSHELRTPLTSIVGLARTAHDRWDELDEERLREFQRIIAEQGERLAQLVNELLLIGRIEEGHLTIDVADVDLGNAVEQAILDSGIDDGPIHVIHPFGSTRIRTDAMLLHEVLVNYLSNAKKYGAPPIAVHFSRHGDELQVVVSDRGAPVPPEFRSKLFERFTRATNVTGTPGTGLGLAIVREVSEKLGGDAWYEPNPEGGNRFCARFTVGWIAAASGDAAAAQARPSHGLAPTATPATRPSTASEPVP